MVRESLGLEEVKGSQTNWPQYLQAVEESTSYFMRTDVDGWRSTAVEASSSSGCNCRLPRVPPSLGSFSVSWVCSQFGSWKGASHSPSHLIWRLWNASQNCVIAGSFLSWEWLLLCFRPSPRPHLLHPPHPVYSLVIKGLLVKGRATLFILLVHLSWWPTWMRDHTFAPQWVLKWGFANVAQCLLVY